MTFGKHWSRSILFRLTARSTASKWCMIAGTNENEYKVPIDMGDMIIEHSSGGNSTYISFDSAKRKRKHIEHYSITFKFDGQWLYWMAPTKSAKFNFTVLKNQNADCKTGELLQIKLHC